MRTFEKYQMALRDAVGREDAGAEAVHEAADDMAALVSGPGYLPIRRLANVELMGALSNAPNTAIRIIIQKVVEQLLDRLVEETHRSGSYFQDSAGGVDDGDELIALPVGPLKNRSLARR